MATLEPNKSSKEPVWQYSIFYTLMIPGKSYQGCFLSYVMLRSKLLPFCSLYTDTQPVWLKILPLLAFSYLLLLMVIIVDVCDINVRSREDQIVSPQGSCVTYWTPSAVNREVAVCFSHIGKSNNNKVLSFVSRCGHLGWRSRRFECILLVFFSL